MSVFCLTFHLFCDVDKLFNFFEPREFKEVRQVFPCFALCHTHTHTHTYIHREFLLPRRDFSHDVCYQRSTELPTYRALDLNHSARHRPLSDVIICVTNYDARTTLNRVNLWHTSRHSKRIHPEAACRVLTVKHQVIIYACFGFYLLLHVPSVLHKDSHLMLCGKIIAVCSQIHTKHINTLCGQSVEMLDVKLAVHIVTTGLCKVKSLL